MLRKHWLYGLLVVIGGLVVSADTDTGAVAQNLTSAAGSELLSACYSSKDLAARSGERRPRRGIRKFDQTPPIEGLAETPWIPKALRGVIRRVNVEGDRRLVALTLDLCETTGEVSGYDGDIFDFLRSQNIRATVFAGGKWLRSHPERAHQLILDPLFEIANHAEAHRNLRLLSGKALSREILGPQHSYETLRSKLAQSQCLRSNKYNLSHVPRRLGLFRFPFGACNAISLKAVNDAGLLAIQWDVSTGDPSPTQSARTMVSHVVKRTKPGSILIAHANGRGYNTAQALPMLVSKLKAKGFEFVTVSELLAAGKPVLAKTCYDSRPGDTDRYDRLFRRAKTRVSRRR